MKRIIFTIAMIFAICLPQSSFASNENTIYGKWKRVKSWTTDYITIRRDGTAEWHGSGKGVYTVNKDGFKITWAKPGGKSLYLIYKGSLKPGNYMFMYDGKGRNKATWERVK